MTFDADLQNPKLRKHERYWFDDGSIVLCAQDHLYKVHRTLLYRHSRALASSDSEPRLNEDTPKAEGMPIFHVPDDVSSRDFEALLEYLYHDAPLDDTTPFERTASLLKVSSQQQLDVPAIHILARSRLQTLFPSDPEAFVRATLRHTEQALALAEKFDIPAIRKTLYYSVATHPHEPEAPVPSEAESDHSLTHPELPKELSARCDALLEQIVSHFTPILFTVATAGHMACTDTFAEKWMPLVIQPALDDNGLCRPLETLDRIIAIDWAKEGLCAECVKDKTEEWRAEQRDMWAKIDEWLQ
ncbi:hypothetical protein C8Q74DRAFT_108439 [Fomes fomentarius]|nr:hypothetical protein C8Q74DRAFT_108439 [Fomes fomentarius]